MGIANLVLLGIALGCQGFLLVMLFRRHVFWQYPFFIVYTSYAVIAMSALLATSSHYNIYYYAYWANEGGLNVLAILALHEVFRKTFSEFYVQYRWFRVLFPVATLLTIVITVWSTAHSLGLLKNHLMRMILSLGISVNFIKVGLFCLIMFIARTFKLRWQFAPLGIILGFAISGAGSAITYWARSEFGTGIEKFLEYVPPVAYILAIVVWLDAFFFRPDPGPGKVTAATLWQWVEEIRQDARDLEQLKDKFR